jgi:Carboxypeptidase regulatory-like domain
VPVVALCILGGACALWRRSDDPNEPCPSPPTIAVARWTPISSEGVIQGTVFRVESLRDPTPQPLADAHISIIGPIQRTITGDSAGHFRFVGLPSGNYVVYARRIGFPTRRDSLRIEGTGLDGEIRLRSDAIVFPNCCHSQVCL